MLAKHAPTGTETFAVGQFRTNLSNCNLILRNFKSFLIPFQKKNTTDVAGELPSEPDIRTGISTAVFRETYNRSF